MPRPWAWRRRRWRLLPVDLDSTDRADLLSALGRFLLMGLAALVLIAVPVSFWIHAESEDRALERAVGVTQRLAGYAVANLAVDELLAGDEAVLQQLDARMQPWLEEGTVLRIKVWDADGRILYSDVAPLIGQQFEFGDAVGQLRAGVAGAASLGIQDDLENAYESAGDELLEVYVQQSTASGEPLIFEAYYDGEDVRQVQLAVLLGVVPASVLALAALQLAQLVPAVRLARRIQSDQARKRALLERAIDASDLERRRIARDLHGEVIQDLAGLSYAMESEEMRGSSESRPLFTRARSILQNDVRTLLAMTGNLDPPDLHEAGLHPVLERLAERLMEQGIEVSLNLDDELQLEQEQAAILYRVARETLANVSAHAQARTVELTLRSYPNRTELRIRDDGRGFDPEMGAAGDRLGLRIVRSTVTAAGGFLDVTSAAGAGTCLTVTLPAARVNQGRRLTSSEVSAR